MLIRSAYLFQVPSAQSAERGCAATPPAEGPDTPTSAVQSGRGASGKGDWRAAVSKGGRNQERGPPPLSFSLVSFTASAPGVAPSRGKSLLLNQSHLPSHPTIFSLSLFFFPPPSSVGPWPLFLAFFSCHFRVFHLLITCRLRSPQSVFFQTHDSQQPVPLGHPRAISWSCLSPSCASFRLLLFPWMASPPTRSGIQARDSAASLTLGKSMQSPDSRSGPSLLSLERLLSSTSPCCCPG